MGKGYTRCPKCWRDELSRTEKFLLWIGYPRMVDAYIVMVSAHITYLGTGGKIPYDMHRDAFVRDGDKRELERMERHIA